ncbi:hypothetical protein GCM10017044_13060 [Kordiimonas sediminis]|uniref:HTH araC/xylS-type domain-containing protein n=1 Tax=Kordiimonas sediminis TaxID=1735581 RepID=A0A919AQE5_9PROT|nr:bifunctional transcriptional activator/DNA repair enzyme AdaA [Kordiimonas sediminis]GHF19694.1 hypothetical protein GCM10017044_13060 [Kordiimonas sediminis]
MKEDTHILYTALLTRDQNYDGKVYFGVTSTGIYCRPVCPANKPKPENILYFNTSDQAQDAGFRACKRCRPESRPGSPAWEGTKSTVQRALRLLAAGEEDIPALADKLGVTDRHLRRLFVQHLGQSPKEVQLQNRLELALEMLAVSQAPISDIAYSAGFRSLRRFNDAFKQHTGTSPSQWRKQNDLT